MGNLLALAGMFDLSVCRLLSCAVAIHRTAVTVWLSVLVQKAFYDRKINASLSVIGKKKKIMQVWGVHNLL